MSKGPRRRRRQSVTFTDEAAETVEKLAAERGTSVSEVVREAVALGAWLQQVRDERGKIYVKEVDEDTPHEVVFRS